jgi:Glycosyl hydrolase family 14
MVACPSCSSAAELSSSHQYTSRAPIHKPRARTQAYGDYIEAFAAEFGDMLGDVVSEVTVGCGPAGELRYPSYPEGDRRWRFPGVGQFQCFDKYMLASLSAAAQAVGEPQWCATLTGQLASCSADDHRRRCHAGVPGLRTSELSCLPITS